MLGGRMEQQQPGLEELEELTEEDWKRKRGKKRKRRKKRRRRKKRKRKKRKRKKKKRKRRNAVTRCPAGVVGPASLLGGRMEGDNWALNCSAAVSPTHFELKTCFGKRPQNPGTLLGVSSKLENICPECLLHN